MLSLDVSKMPQGLQSFARGGQVDFQALESTPNKLLKFYLHYLTLQSDTSTLAQQIFTATKQEMQRVLLAQYDAKILSDYHFAKFLFHNPDLLKGREAEVMEIVSEFANQLNPSSDAKTLRRASKILEWVRSNPELREQSREVLGRISQVGEYRVTSSDGEEFSLDLSLWSAKVVAWRSWLINGMSQAGPVSCSLKQLLEIDQFLKTSSLPDLTLDGFMELYKKAEELLFQDLAKACAQKIKEKLSNETLGEILPQALACNYEPLILNCLDYIRRNKLISVYDTLDWSVQGGLYLKMSNIRETPSELSTYLYSNAQSICLNPPAMGKVIDRKLIFPEATCVKFSISRNKYYSDFVNDDGFFEIEKIFKNFSTCFPKAKEIFIHKKYRGDVSLIKDMTQGTWVFKDEKVFLAIKAEKQAAQPMQQQQAAQPQRFSASTRQLIVNALHRLSVAGEAGLPLSRPQVDNALLAMQDLRALGALGQHLLANFATSFPAARLAMEAVTFPQQQTASASADSTSGAPQTTSDDASASETKREAPKTREKNTSGNEPPTKRARKDD